MQPINMQPTIITRPIASIGRYFGGKALLARHILPWLPPSERYIEPFGGLFSVGLNHLHQDRTYCELNKRVFNLLLQIQQQPSALTYALVNSDRSKEALKVCWEPSAEPLEDARRYYWVCVTRYCGGGTNWDSGISVDGLRRASAHRMQRIGNLSRKLSGVSVRHTDGIETMLSSEFNCPTTLAYVDPPYGGQGRRSRDSRHEQGRPRRQYACDLNNHEPLINALQQFQGMVVLSGYLSSLYCSELADWTQVDIQTRDQTGGERTDSLWLNPAAHRSLERQLSLPLA